MWSFFLECAGQWSLLTFISTLGHNFSKNIANHALLYFQVIFFRVCVNWYQAVAICYALVGVISFLCVTELTFFFRYWWFSKPWVDSVLPTYIYWQNCFLFGLGSGNCISTVWSLGLGWSFHRVYVCRYICQDVFFFITPLSSVFYWPSVNTGECCEHWSCLV